MDEARAQEDIALIRRLLEDARTVVVDRGRHFIIWGWISAVGSVLTYLYVTGAAGPHPGVTWGVLLAVGWGASMVVGWRDARRARVTTAARRLLSVVWVSAAVSLTLVALAGMFGGVLGSRALPGVLSVVLGAPILVTMRLTGERWLGLVAAGWWAGGAVLLFVPGPYALLLIAAMSLLLMVAPGLVLSAKARRRSGGGGNSADVA